MQLSPGQLSTLDLMGIPVWELRRRQSTFEIPPTEHNIDSVQPDVRIQQCDWLVVIEKNDHGAQAQRLLQAMLAAIGLSQNQFVIVAHEQLAQLQTLALDQKVVLAFGNTVARSLLGEHATVQECRGKRHQIPPSQLNTIVSFGLTELLQSPEHKALVWQDLKLAKSIHEQFVNTQ